MAELHRRVRSGAHQPTRPAGRCWTSGPDDGRSALLLGHGNLVSGGWWRYVCRGAAGRRARDCAPDAALRFGRHRDPDVPVDATRGLGETPDERATALARDARPCRGRPGQRGGLRRWAAASLMQYLLDHRRRPRARRPWSRRSRRTASAARKDADGTLCCGDGAPSGAGGAAPDFVRRLAEGDRSDGGPAACGWSSRQFFGARDNVGNVDEEFLLDEVLLTATGEDHYPGERRGVAELARLRAGPARRAQRDGTRPLRHLGDRRARRQAADHVGCAVARTR